MSLAAGGRSSWGVGTGAALLAKASSLPNLLADWEGCYAAALHLASLGPGQQLQGQYTSLENLHDENRSA